MKVEKLSFCIPEREYFMIFQTPSKIAPQSIVSPSTVHADTDHSPHKVVPQYNLNLKQHI